MQILSKAITLNFIFDIQTNDKYWNDDQRNKSNDHIEITISL